jgi:carboxypeptidase family protein
MAENKDLYKLGQSITGSIVDKSEEIRIDLELEDNIISDSGTVFGETTDIDGNPLGGVTIKITDTNYVPKYHTVSDDEGQYTIGEVAAGEQYLILSVKDKYKLKTGTPFAMQKSQQIERNFQMEVDNGPANSLVAGEVLNTKKEKLEGATVHLYNNAGETPILLKTTHTNEFGQYAFFDVEKGLYLVSSSLNGYKSAKTTFIIENDYEVRNLLLEMADDPTASMGTINGIIKDKNQQPIIGAFVVLFEVEEKEGKEVLNPIRRTITNSEGLYLFEQVPQGNYKVKANKTID